MKKIKMYTVISLDGFTARKDGDMDWVREWLREHQTTDTNYYGYDDFTKSVGCVLSNLPYYYTLRSNDIRWPPAGMKCFVMGESEYQPPIDKNVIFLPYEADGSNAEELILRLLDEGERDIWLAGDNDLIAYFAEHNLIWEVIVNVFPITLGDGIKLSFGPEDKHWKLYASKVYDNGIVQLNYSLQT